MQKIKYGIFRHYKGNLYKVIGIGRHSETHEDYVVYQALYDSEQFGNKAIWVRPAALFTETVSFEGTIVPRFTFVKDSE